MHSERKAVKWCFEPSTRQLQVLGLINSEAAAAWRWSGTVRLSSLVPEMPLVVGWEITEALYEENLQRPAENLHKYTYRWSSLSRVTATLHRSSVRQIFPVYRLNPLARDKLRDFKCW